MNEPMVFTISTDHLTLNTDRSNLEGWKELDKIAMDDMDGKINIVSAGLGKDKVFYYGEPAALYDLLFRISAEYDVELV